MGLRLYNTLPAQIQPFAPAENNQVRMYACGPTVYDYVHIGNLRTVVAVDVLHRFLLQSGYQVRHVMNITDVDDKIIRKAAVKASASRNTPPNMRKPFSKTPPVSTSASPFSSAPPIHIQKMAEFIAGLVRKA